MADYITPVDQFEEDINFIRTTDKVLGDPPGTTGVLSGPINVVIQKIANSLLNLKNRLDGLNLTVPNASTTVKGIAELITKSEAEKDYENADTTRIVPAKRVHDILRHANAQATDSVRGTVKKAQSNTANTDDTLYITKALAKSMIEEFAPVNKIYTGNANSVTVVGNVSTGYYSLGSVPTGETFLGGKVEAVVNGNYWATPLYLDGNTIKTHNATGISGSGIGAYGIYYWEYWTRE